MKLYFSKLTKGGFNYEIYKIRDDCKLNFPIHGASKDENGHWILMAWDLNGNCDYYDGIENEYDLMPIKRRFKTAQELIDSGYSEVCFKNDGSIYVWIDKECYRKLVGDCIMRSNDEQWIDIFTIADHGNTEVV